MRSKTVVLALLAAMAAGFSLFALLAPSPELDSAAAPAGAGANPAPVSTGPSDANPASETAAAMPQAPSPDSTGGSAQAPVEAGSAPVEPRFDVVRVSPEGEALIAGSAEPDSEVTIRIDGEVRATVRADASGGFVAYVDVPPGDEESAARRIDLDAVDADGRRSSASEPVIVAAPAAQEPDAEPLVVAARETGVEVLQTPGARPAEGAVTLDTAVQDADGVLALSGRAGGLKTVRIYADARLVAETVADADGRWTVDASVEDTLGATSLRIDEVAEDGSVTRRIEAPYVAADPDETRPEPGAIVVQEGDTLWRIAENAFGSGFRYTLIYEANAERIRDPNLIFPGQLLSVPVAAAR